jgi:ankyrin repeat protein
MGHAGPLLGSSPARPQMSGFSWLMAHKPGPGNHYAQLLLQCGANVNAQTKEQLTPLCIASEYRKLEIAQLLLDHAAKVDAFDDIGQTPLHIVSRSDKISEEAGVAVARLLLERGMNVNAQTKKKLTPLCIASEYGKLEIARLLLDRAAKVNALDEFGQTPLHIVSWSNKTSEEAGVAVARLLLERELAQLHPPHTSHDMSHDANLTMNAPHKII